MCDCQFRVHPEYGCSTPRCHCHDEEKTIDSIVSEEEPRVYVSISIDNIGEEDAQRLVDMIVGFRGTRAGMSVYYDTPITKESS